MTQHAFGERHGAFPRAQAHGGAALDDGAVKQACRGRHRQQRADLSAAAGFTEDRDVAWIAAEANDIVAHPFQRGDHVQRSGIAGLAEPPVAERGQVQMAEDVEALIDADHHHVVASRQAAAPQARRIAVTIGESASMEPDHDGPFRVGPRFRSPNIHAETVLGFRRPVRHS